jgi:hypothetical protein
MPSGLPGRGFGIGKLPLRRTAQAAPVLVEPAGVSRKRTQRSAAISERPTVICVDLFELDVGRQLVAGAPRERLGHLGYSIVDWFSLRSVRFHIGIEFGVGDGPDLVVFASAGEGDVSEFAVEGVGCEHESDIRGGSLVFVDGGGVAVVEVSGFEVVGVDLNLATIGRDRDDLWSSPRIPE